MTTSFEDFKASVDCLSPDLSQRVRERFIQEFIDQTDASFAESIHQHRFADGMAYTGYLWDFIKGRTLIDESELWSRVERRDWIYAMWDIHSSEHIRIAGYWRFPKDAVLVSRPPARVREGQRYLPEDLYLFDDSFAWVAAVTHDEIERKRFCLWAGEPYLA